MSIINPITSVNGVIGAELSPLDRGLAYGDGLFETCRMVRGALPLWSLHEERLVAGCERLRIPLDQNKLQAYSQSLIGTAGVTDGILKIIVTRGATGRGYRLPVAAKPNYCLSVFPHPAQIEPASALTVTVCQQRLGINPSLAGIKHLNRLEQVLARAEWEDEQIAEGLLMDVDGHVIEATAANLFVVRDGQLLTPDLSSAGVAGVARRLIIERLAAKAELVVQVLPMTLDDVCRADEIFLCNSIMGIRPVARLLGEPVRTFATGPYTLTLQTAFDDYMYGAKGGRA